MAGKIFLSDICTTDAWPSTETKKELAKEAVSQANAAAITKNFPQIMATQKTLDEVHNSPLMITNTIIDSPPLFILLLGQA